MRNWPIALFEGEGGDGSGGGGGSSPEPSLASAAINPPSDSGSGEAPPFDFRSILNERGEFVDGWETKLPKDYEPYAGTLKGTKDFATLTKRLHDNQAAARAKTEGVVKIPGADAKPEDIAAFHKALGVPETPEGYDLKAPENLPAGIKFDEEQAKEFAGVAHRLGLPPSAVNELVNWKIAAEAKQAEASQKALVEFKAKEEGELQKAFGDKANKKIAEAVSLVEALGFSKEQALYHPAFYHADTVKLLVAASDRIKALAGEDKITSQPGSNGSGQSFLEQARSLQKDPNYRTDKAMQQRVTALYKQAEEAGQLGG